MTSSAQSEPLRLSRLLHAPRETVFRAWSEARHVKAWFAPEGFIVPDATVDMREGGRFDLSMRSPRGEEHWIRGRVLEVTPNERLVIGMRITDAAGKALFDAHTAVTLADALGGTRLDVEQRYTLIDPGAGWMVQGAPHGWASTLDKLEAEVLRMRGAGDSTSRSVAHGSFHLERTYEAPVERVWRAFTQVEAKQAWFSGPPGKWELLERHMDVREGGTERLKGRWEGGMVSSFDAMYRDVVPQERLVYSYTMHLNERKISVSLATIELQAEPGRTTVRVAEQGAFLDGYDDAGAREHGTGLLLDALGASLHT